MTRRWKVYAWVAALVVIVDQVTKLWARHALPVDAAGHGIRVPVIQGFFDLVLARNTGAAFSLLARTGGTRIILTVFGLAAIAGITWMVKRAREDQIWLVAALALMAGGAVGNLIDRILFGRVTDFVLWHWHEHTWPVFNLADACLSIAIAVFAANAAYTLWRARKFA